MKYDTVFGTYLELRAAASYFQLPIYVCTQRSGSLKYYWDYIPPHPNIDLVPPSKKFITCVPQVMNLLGGTRSIFGGGECNPSSTLGYRFSVCRHKLEVEDMRQQHGVQGKCQRQYHTSYDQHVLQCYD